MRSAARSRPTEFIPVAEESGLIVALGRWALDTAMRRSRLGSRTAAALPLSVSVNLSADPDRARRCRRRGRLALAQRHERRSG
jgi:EAL domain-containing protein (putative c-di-GMP-specific phosphodiesterase class I)